MDQFDQLLQDVQTYAAQKGCKPDWVCRLATGNVRLWPRLRTRIDMLKADADRLRQFMDENPIDGRGDA